MILTSTSFIFFFILVAGIYFVLPYRLRWVWLLGSSYFFYMAWKPLYLFLLVGATLITYLSALAMGREGLESKRKAYFILCVGSNVGVLFLFKYFNFFNDFLGTLFGPSYPVPGLDLLLPIGLSFYIFKSISYGIDVYQGDQKPENHFGRFALYVAFFPQLLAGPIERATRLLPQFYQRFPFDYKRVTDGIKWMLWGFFQKMVIADNLARLVDAIYNQPAEWEGLPIAIATLFYAFQIYCDFSGYSDIAIGAAQVLGITTMKNFNRPYFAKSIPEFWRRWHISLSTWFRDYLYIPLGGNRVSLPRWYFNLFIVLIICGLWHGANWTFIVWGGLHGFYLVLSASTQTLREKIGQVIGLDRMPRLHQTLRMGMTFLLVCFAWIFFRAPTLSDALEIISRLLVGWGNFPNALENVPFWSQMKFEWITGLLSIGVLISVEALAREGNVLHLLSSKPIWVRWPVYYFLLLSILLFGEFGSTSFIYFQF